MKYSKTESSFFLSSGREIPNNIIGLSASGNMFLGYDEHFDAFTDDPDDPDRLSREELNEVCDCMAELWLKAKLP
jgi:hypothetical protein